MRSASVVLLTAALLLIGIAATLWAVSQAAWWVIPNSHFECPAGSAAYARIDANDFGWHCFFPSDEQTPGP